MKLYKFRRLGCIEDLCRIKDIIDNGFYCNIFLDFNDMNEGVFPVNENNKEITLEQKGSYKICSFSAKRALNSELMWGHYANAGKGVVIEVDTGVKMQNLKKDANIYKVRYGGGEFNTEIKILKNKSKAWQYECEYRYLYLSNKLEDNEVDIGKITKIYFGTPYEVLGNYEAIHKKHTKLQEYLACKKCLEAFCHQKKIKFKDHIFKFNYMTKAKQTPT